MATLPALLSNVDDLVTGSTTAVVASSSDPLYVMANLKTERVCEVWRSIAGALSSIDLTFDFGAAKPVNLIALLNHNLSATATIAFAMGSTTAYADYSTTIPWRDKDAFLYIASAPTYRYARMRITDTSNLYNYLQAGGVRMGSATVLTMLQTIAQGWHQIDGFMNLSNPSEWGSANVDEMYEQDRLLFSFDHKTAAELAVVRNIFKAVKANKTPLVLVPDIAGTDAFYGRFTKTDFDRSMDAGEVQSANLEFTQDSRGRDVTI